ncbi:helix-turn-helix domain-containing protein [Marixanthomonas ophiurae]|uniref:XRE family transcriptional regulator n=1 Tax=Marixanthomonas ophiurae TaxID=387659 RepID=A0A3E1Q862_9FLAO|nr:XRE family transcriptional regulator [Marixanthomonas ophiurae]
MVNSEDFTKRLEKIMDFYGLSATAFSEAIDFNRSTISHLLSGRNKPSLEFVMQVVQKFPEVELYWLLNGKGSFPTQKENEEPVVDIKKSSISNIPKEAFREESISGKETEIDKIVIFYKDGSFKAYEN